MYENAVGDAKLSQRLTHTGKKTIRRRLAKHKGTLKKSYITRPQGRRKAIGRAQARR